MPMASSLMRLFEGRLKFVLGVTFKKLMKTTYKRVCYAIPLFSEFSRKMNDFEAFRVIVIVICVINFYSEIHSVWVYQTVARVHLMVFLKVV